MVSERLVSYEICVVSLKLFKVIIIGMTSTMLENHLSSKKSPLKNVEVTTVSFSLNVKK